ncbi:MAG: AMP-binding protein [Eubacteriaceae bacterium]|nr:AMP-binding protein [Eubacteriaceae bacterium]
MDSKSGLVYHNFVDEEFDSKGRLVKISFKPEDSYNFAFDCIDDVAAKTPSKPAMVWLNDDKTDERIFTFADMSEMSKRTANFFVSLGIKKGDRVMLVLKRHYSFWFSILALHRIGAVAVPATNQLVEKDLVYRFDKANITAIVCTGDGQVKEECEKAFALCPQVVIKILCGPKRDGWEDFEAGVTASSPGYGRQDTHKDEDMLMYFTSGTTGYPRLVAHAHTYSLAHITTARHWHNVNPDGIHFTVSDTGWGKSVWGKLYGQWLCEACVMTYDFEKFAAHDLLVLFAKYKITSFCAPPTIFRFFIKEDLGNYDLSSLEYVCTAGEALNPEVFNKFYEHTGLKIMEGFGQTETTLTIANLVNTEPKPGSMGLPNPQYDIMVVDPDGSETENGQIGEVVIRYGEGRPYGLFKEYVDDAEASANALRDGIYHTGDTVWRDEDGYLWFVGRTDDLIKSSGYRISPFEIESVIMELPYVLECAVIGVPDDLRGQLVKAYIVLVAGTEGSDELKKQIQAFTQKATAPYKYPRLVEFIDELPKTISGKIRKVELRQMSGNP